MSDTYLGQIKQDGVWKDYARGGKQSSFAWAAADTRNRRIVDWIDKDRVLYPEPTPDKWIVETFYNTDNEGAWVADDDWSNRTLHGPFDTSEEAEGFMQHFQEGDTDVKDMHVRRLTDPTEYVNPIPKD